MGVASRLVRGAALALLLLPLPLLTGCQMRTITIQLPGYGDGAIDGVWLWKQVGGVWTRMCRIDFTDRRITEQGETLSYAQNCINGRERRGVVLATPIARLSGTPTTITVELIYLRYETPGSYRATAFNAAGESALSSTSLPL
jgi:hypothetical protein